ncbi:MAG: hypothetical protein GY869_24050 [Planctomycetes bacterium]|nr:hypothetical protein [Planctomycetota bacterium]
MAAMIAPTYPLTEHRQRMMTLGTSITYQHYLIEIFPHTMAIALNLPDQFDTLLDDIHFVR